MLTCRAPSIRVTCMSAPSYPRAVYVYAQVCAAKGKLPGQASQSIIFSHAPSALDPAASSSKPFGHCRGWRPLGMGSECLSTGYATDDIFFLEVCIFNQICVNGADLFQLRQGEPFECVFSSSRFEELRRILLRPPTRPTQLPVGATGPGCEKWCNPYTCAKYECNRCTMDCN